MKQKREISENLCHQNSYGKRPSGCANYYANLLPDYLKIKLPAAEQPGLRNGEAHAWTGPRCPFRPFLPGFSDTQRNFIISTA
jgi:hypothetical protein